MCSDRSHAVIQYNSTLACVMLFNHPNPITRESDSRMAQMLSGTEKPLPAVNHRIRPSCAFSTQSSQDQQQGTEQLFDLTAVWHCLCRYESSVALVWTRLCAVTRTQPQTYLPLGAWRQRHPGQSPLLLCIATHSRLCPVRTGEGAVSSLFHVGIKGRHICMLLSTGARTRQWICILNIRLSRKKWWEGENSGDREIANICTAFI